MQQVALTGDLQEFSIEDVLGLLKWGKTGTLSVKHEQEEIVIYFVKGAITDAEHLGVPQLTFGEILSRAGYLTAQQLQEISIIRLRNQRRVGAVLVELGLISQKVLEDYLRLRMRNAARDLLMWQDGTFSFQRGMPPAGVGLSLQMDIKEAIADGKQLRTEWGTLGSRIRGLDYVVQLVGERANDIDPNRLSAAARRVLSAIDGRSTIRMIAQCLFLNDVQAAQAVDELLQIGVARLMNYQPAVKVNADARLAEDDQAEDDLIGLLAKSQLIPASINSDKPGDRIKALLGALQDCVNDLLVYQDSQHGTDTEAGSKNLNEEYLEQRFGDILTELQGQYFALQALQVVNRRVDASDLIDSYSLILGDTRHTFYMQAVQGLSTLVKSIFDWVIGDEIDNPVVAAECQEAWHTFFREIEAKVAELAVADGWGKKAGISSLFRWG